jgi:hypothetical protein
MACPATRAGFASAAREMMLEPALGPDGFWTRLRDLAVPALFVWGERDRIVSTSFAHRIALTCPQVPQLLLPCVAHWLNGPHHRCLAEAMAVLVEELRTHGHGRARAAEGVSIGAARLETRACVACEPRARGSAPRAAHGRSDA